MSTDVYRNGRFEPNDFPVLGSDEALPAGGGVLLPKARFAADRPAVLESNAPFGLVLEPNDRIDDIAADLGRFPVIAVRFPKFADGRAFSLARLLREKHGYAGEIRAIGDVLIDLVPFMGRVGITAFEVANEPTRAALTEGRQPIVPYFYQPAADAAEVPPGRPWLRKAAG